MIQPQNINQAIQYQDDSIVSKEIIKNSSGTVTLFAFDKNQGLSEHTTPFGALVIITDGIAEITIAGIKHKISSGEMLLMPASVPHKLKAVESFKMILTMIKTKSA